MKSWVALPLALALSACWPHPPPAPAPYHAFGGPPRWDLIIDQVNVTFISAGQEIRQPRPTPIGGIAGEIYQTPRIHANITHTGCTDAGTGRTYPDRVQVTVDGRRYEGCGGL